MDDLKTTRTTLRRKPDRGSHDFDTIAAILDEGLVCHLAFVADGQPYVVPTTYGRDGDALYVHGSSASRMLRALSRSISVCLTVTLLDGVVFARSVFHHSMNYRSVMVLGRARAVEGEEKLRGLRAVVEHTARGRWDDARQPTAQELNATSVLRLDIAEASAKIRTGGPLDDDADYRLPHWAGVVPLRLASGAPIADTRLAPGIEPPAYARDYRRRP
jgi:hypothetical protein